MKLNIIYLLLLLLLCATLFPSCTNLNKKNVDTSSNHDNILINREKVDTSALDTIVEKEAIDMINDFYKTYTTHFLSSNKSFSTEDSIKKNFLTKRLIEKIDRIGASTGTNPIIRAQDFSKEAIKSLNEKHLKNSWYMVSYTWEEGSEFEQKTNIPLKVIRVNGRYMIDYITPDWNDSLYGDSLLCNHPTLPTIDNSTPLSFLKTFYDAYTLKYGSMPESLAPQLAALRAAHFTTKALAQFDAKEKEHRASDGCKDYDSLIDDYDFDYLWRSSIKVTQLNEMNYQVDYTNKTLHSIKIKLVKLDQQYRIDNVIKE